MTPALLAPALMAPTLLLSGLLGAGLWLIVMGQPLGRPRPRLEARLHRMSAQGRMELEAGEQRTPVFDSPLLERTLRPLLDDAGTAMWAAGTHGNDGSAAIVQDDGNLVIYASDGRPLWASDTCCR